MQLAPDCVYKYAKLASNGTITTTIDLSKHYILFSDLIQSTDNTFRAGAYYINKGTISTINDSGGEGYIQVTLTGTTLTIYAPTSATNPRRIMLIQLD